MYFASQALARLFQWGDRVFQDRFQWFRLESFRSAQWREAHVSKVKEGSNIVWEKIHKHFIR
jgi:hypothetical protein